MKALWVSICLILCVVGVHAQDLAAKSYGANQNLAPAKFDWSELTKEIGSVAVGKSATYTFTFTNEGQKDLQISGVTASWGATASYPTAPIAAGETSKISVEFTPKSAGAFREFLTVISNTEEFSVTLTLKGEAK